jgi:hypothetical protein
MAEGVQTYQNHTRLFPAYHFFVLPVLLLYALNAIRHLIFDPSLSTAFAMVVAFALLTFALVTRVQTLTVQDRVIRLEMQLRLGGLLPPDLASRVDQIGVKQLVALRFASDAELPDLVREVLGGSCGSPKAIKQRVKSWRPDFLRA